MAEWSSRSWLGHVEYPQRKAPAVSLLPNDIVGRGTAKVDRSTAAIYTWIDSIAMGKTGVVERRNATSRPGGVDYKPSGRRT